MSSAVIGACFCGKTCYYTTGPIYGLSFCYCVTCQLVHGAPFAPFTNVKREHLQWISNDHLVELKSSTFAKRTFCGSCHAPITMEYDGKRDEVALCAVTIDEKQSMDVPELEEHIFVRSKPSWYVISDSRPQVMGTPEDLKQLIS